jgi:hypothetical protein
MSFWKRVENATWAGFTDARNRFSYDKGVGTYTPQRRPSGFFERYFYDGAFNLEYDALCLESDCLAWRPGKPIPKIKFRVF